MKSIFTFLYSWQFRTFLLTLNAVYLASMTYGASSTMNKIVPDLLSLCMMYCAVSIYKEGKKVRDLAGLVYRLCRILPSSRKEFKSLTSLHERIS